MVPLSLTARDFDAYAPERTRATAMTAPRSAVKARLLDWAKDLAERLAAEGIDLDVAATDEHPSPRNGHRVEQQSAFLFRTANARKAMEHGLGRSASPIDEELGHARVELRVDAQSVSLVLWLGGDARADLEHAQQILSHDEDDLFAIWESLPDGICVEARSSLSARARRAAEMTPRDVATMAREALESEVPLVLGVRLAKDDALGERALDGFDGLGTALARLLAILAWSPESAARLADRPSRRGKRTRLPRVAPPPPTPLTPAQTIDRGTHVRALAGPFAGQAGVVQELDGKGGARVLFGLLAARVELRELTIADKKRGRPVLSSSHRKPQT
ncbi:MAG TPA: hypothetical protein VH054_23345 [Polyangiaceae bacterium]|nr:hypothetical protein [Polyangiaceae bacterium]